MRFAWRPATEVLVLPAILACLVLDAAVPKWWSGVPAAVAMVAGIVLAVGVALQAQRSRSVFIRRARVAPIVAAIVVALTGIFLARGYLAFQQFQGWLAQEGTRTYDALFGALLLAAIVLERQGTLIARLALRAAQQPMLILTASFAALIACGTLLLVLPISVHSIEDISLLDALFTMTSAVCVTGLVVNDPGATYTGFGEAVILSGIQLGGIGFMTVAAFALQFRGGAALRDQSRYAAMLGANSLSALRRTIRGVVLATLAIELIGALLLLGLWAGDPRLDGRSAIWISAFTAVSAFCNAGFSLFADGMISFQRDTLCQLVIMTLIVCGGFGFPVLRELAVGGLQRARRYAKKERPRPPRFSVTTRVVLGATGFLIVAGATAIALLESGGIFQGLPFLDRVVGAVFTSVTSRTAGFNNVDVGALQAATLLLIMILMFIGGSPASTAGGIKTTTAAVLAATIRAEVTGSEPSLFHRALTHEVRRRATAVAGLSISVVLVSLMGLTLVERAPFLPLAFEAVSAFSTTGLSTGITPGLSPMGKLLIVTTMFVGRVGPLTIALAAGAPELQRHRLAQTSLSVG